MNSFYQAVSGGVSVARLVYSQARIIGNQADDPGFFCAGMVREHFYLDGNQKIKFFMLCRFEFLSLYLY